MVLRIQESDDKITAKSFKELLNKLEAHGYSCGRYYDVNPESNWLYIHKDGNPYEAEFYRYRDGEYELYLHNIRPTKQESYAESYEDSNEDNEGYEYIESKSVYDSDGFITDYTMYYDHYEGRYIFVLGDKDVYNPMNTYSDWTCDTQEEAYEWFDSYNGFEDDEYVDESCKKKSKKKPMKEYANEEHGIIKCVETGEEYGYSSLVDKEWIIADLVDKGYSYKDRPVRIETGYREYDNYLD